MTTFVLIPGAWMGAWVWEPITRSLRALGHHVYPVTLSGLSRGSDVSHVGLATHVNDVLSLLEANDLRDVVVVGHLYSGIVAGMVADRAPDRVMHTVFVEAFLPHNGTSLLDAFDEHQREDELRQIAEHQGHWPAPDITNLADGNGLSTEQIRWLVERFVGHPGRTISEPAALSRPLAEQRATYIACMRGGHWLSDEVAAMRKEPNWTFRTIDTGHWPMVSAPDELVALLAEVAESMSMKGIDAGKMMALPQGDLELLESDVAKRLLTSTIPARLAYIGTDNTPRVVSLWFHWTGHELVMATFAPSPKIGALRANPNVAITIDTDGFPPDALLIRGQASVSEIAGAVPEYALAAHRYLGEEDATAYLLQVDQPGTTMARIAVSPTWVGVLDFQIRFPSALPQQLRS